MGFFDKLKNKNEYYYDFGTGKKIKIEDSNKKDDFLEGFNSVTDTPIAKTLRYESEEEAKPVTLPYTKNTAPRAIEFGEDSETYKILQDLGNRWYQTDSRQEKTDCTELPKKLGDFLEVKIV